LYSNELLKVARITAAKERLVEIEKAVLSLSKSSDPSALQTFGNFLLSVGDASKFASAQAQSFAGNIVEQKNALDAEKQALLGIITTQTLADAATQKGSGAPAKTGANKSKKSIFFMLVSSEKNDVKFVNC